MRECPYEKPEANSAPNAGRADQQTPGVICFPASAIGGYDHQDEEGQFKRTAGEQ